MASLRTHRILRAMALLAIAITIVAGFPGQPAEAQGSEIQTLDNSQVQFARGVFQRTSISPDLSPISTVPPDVRGAVQLAPTGALKPWEKIAVELPTARTAQGDDGTRSDAGVVALGNRLFVLAGTNGAGSTDTALWASLNQITGDIITHGVASGDPRFVDENWLNVPLPAAAIVPNCVQPIAKRTRAAAAALPTGANSGFIYVVGGLTPFDTGCGDGATELTASGIQIGRVAEDGALTWASSSNQLPSGPILVGDVEVDLGPRGVERSAAVVVRTASGKAFLYVIGGLSTYDRITGPESAVERTVFRSEINPTNGTLGDWVRDDNVPLLGGALGIYDHIAAHVTTTVNTDAGSSVKDGILIAGGFTGLNQSDPSIFVYRATINPADGDLTWDATPSSDGNEVTLGLGGQVGMSSVAYNNKIYLVGGAVPSDPPAERGRDTVLTATFNDNLELQPIPGSTEYFVGRSQAVLPLGPRIDSGAALMDALPPPDNPTGDLGSAWALVVGGFDGSGQRSRFIFRGRIGGDEADGSIRATDGWFYSVPFNVTFQRPGQSARNARVLSIRWAAEVKRTANANADMVVQFRKSLRSDPNCPDESVFGANDRWFTLDADPASPFHSLDSTAERPFNTVTLRDAFGTEDFIATCFQYRVRFIQNGLDANGLPVAAASPSGTPRLFSMNIEKVVAGNADIRVKGFGYNAPGGRLANLDMVIQNLSLEGLENTQDAGLDDNDGGFWVHLCIAYAAPGQGTPTLDLPTLPLADGQKVPCMRAYYQVYKWQMRSGRELALLTSGGQAWRRQISDTEEETISDIRSLFSEPGTYRVALLLDTWNYVREGTAGELNNRGEEAGNNNQPQILTIEITGPPINVIYMPQIRK